MTAQKNHMTFATSDEGIGAANATRAAEAAALASDAFARSDDAYRALAAEYRRAAHPLHPSFALAAYEVAAESAAAAASAAAEVAEHVTPHPLLVPDDEVA